MFRLLFRTVNTARNSSVNVQDLCVLLANCDKSPAPALRVAYRSGVKALSTSSVRLCEKKSDVASSPQNEKESDKEADSTETPTVVTQKAEDDSRVVKAAEQSEEPPVLNTDDGSAPPQQKDVTTEEVEATPKQAQINVAKSGKEGLLELLGAMKVEVTTKKKLRNSKVQQSFKPTTKSEQPAMESTISMFQQATEEVSSQSVTLDPKLVAAASAAAATLPNARQAESELLRQLRHHETVAEAQKKGDVNNLGEIIADMKVGRHRNRQNTAAVHQIQSDEDGLGYLQIKGINSEPDGKRKILFSEKRLNIFSPPTAEDDVEPAAARPTLWDVNFAYQLSMALNQAARNGLEEMIQWTREGKMWPYPINNETGLEEEAAVSFYEHVFLESHLEEGFPRQGPVRHFMELVLAGLSKNPYLTVQQKKEHISWFRDYFHQKEEVLKEADVYIN